MLLGLTQPLTETSTRIIPGSKGQPAHKADNLTIICELTVLENVGASVSYNPMGLGWLYLLPLHIFCYHVHTHTYIDIYFLHKFIGTGSKIVTLLISKVSHQQRCLSNLTWLTL
jgi:hypothetical protein